MLRDPTMRMPAAEVLSSAHAQYSSRKRSAQRAAARKRRGAVRDWLENGIKPKAEGHDKFEVVVAMNALGIVMRDLDAGVRAEDEALAAALLSGETTLAEPGLLASLRRAALEKCAVDSPKYAALAAARAEWGG